MLVFVCLELSLLVCLSTSGYIHVGVFLLVCSSTSGYIHVGVCHVDRT